MHLLLRFRDLQIPDGETVNLHNVIAQRDGHVHWGWIMRGNEQFPTQEIMVISEKCEAGTLPISMIHTGSGKLYQSHLLSLTASPDGNKIGSPELAATPTYMHQAQCAVWFRIAEIQENPEPKKFRIHAMPTLRQLASVDELMLRNGASLDEFINSSATLWVLDK